MRSFDLIQIKFLLKLYNYLYKRISFLARKINGGVHPKHRILAYYEYFLRLISEGSKVLDIGCGHGELDYQLANKAKTIIGIDINQNSIRMAQAHFQKDNIKYIVGDATKYQFQEHFDYIILSNVLEHVKNRIEFLLNIKNLASTILIRVPMINRSWIVLYEKELNIEYRLDNSHCVEYTYETFEKEMNQVGLKIISHSIQFGEIWAHVEKKSE
jgi:2-polyprenyl-3-methyl-5-hydroxy-6-metoxy-1,4-benzoquinol methylase